MTGAGDEGRTYEGWRFLPEAFTSLLVLNLMTLEAIQIAKNAILQLFYKFLVDLHIGFTCLSL